jgi:ferredoxin-nitrite reductase
VGHNDASPAGPESIHFEAQNRFTEAGKKLAKEEKAKREKNPLDLWDEVQARADAGEFPKSTDVFLMKSLGMFYVAPAQDSYMCRLRLPGGIIDSRQFRGVADLAQHYGGGYSHVTTRANLQIREIGPSDPPNVLMGLADLGILNRGAGADNIRNITASPTAGIDPQELIDTRPLARQMHHYILNHREMYNLPRKFNIAFDGGGTISALADTNDIGFRAVRINEAQPTEHTPAGIYMRMELAGITGHRQFADDVGWLLSPNQCVSAAAAVLRVFIQHGDRTNRQRARLKYLIDDWGMETFLASVKQELAFAPVYWPREDCEMPPSPHDQAHIGFHPQQQDGLYYAGVVLPVGRLTIEQMQALARIADDYGSGTIRLTCEQNLLISDIHEPDIEPVKRAIEDAGLGWQAHSVRAGLVACTGNGGCKFSASDTKGHAMQVAEYVEARLDLDQPINIHLTGCPHSCAQHYIGDIGLLGTSVAVPSDSTAQESDDDEDEGEEVEGYHVYVGGGYGEHRGIAEQVYESVPADDLPPLIEHMVRVYLDHCTDETERFRDFVRRHDIETLKELFGEPPKAAIA